MEQGVQNNGQRLTAHTIQGSTVVQASSVENLHVQASPLQPEEPKVEDAIRIDYTYGAFLPAYLLENFEPTVDASYYMSYDPQSLRNATINEQIESVYPLHPYISIDVVSVSDAIK